MIRLFHIKKWLVILPAVLLAFGGMCQQGFYYDDGVSFISHHPDANPEKMVVKEWQVRLYKKNMPTGSKDHWGLIIGKTAQEVMEKLKKSQEFEISYTKWTKDSTPYETRTYFNPLGPIAVVSGLNVTKHSDTKYKFYLEEITSHYNVYIKPNQELFNKVIEILGKKKINSSSLDNPFSAVNTVMKDYIESLAFANKQMSLLHNKLTIANLPEDTLKEEIDKIYYEGTRKVLKASFELRSLFNKFLDAQAALEEDETEIMYYKDLPGKPVKSITYYRDGRNYSQYTEFYEDGRVKEKGEQRGSMFIGFRYIVLYDKAYTRTIYAFKHSINSPGTLEYTTIYSTKWKAFLIHNPMSHQSHTMQKMTDADEMWSTPVEISNLPTNVLDALKLRE